MDFFISSHDMGDPFFWIQSILISLAQGGFILGGLIFLGLGLLMTYSEIFMGKDQRITKAKIIGVRVENSKTTSSNQNMYYPVFEYVGDNGQITQAESLSGSSNLRNKIPGSFVKVKVDADTQDWVSPVGLVWLIISIIFVGVGGGMIFGAATFAKITFITIGVWGLFFLQIALKVRKSKIIIPKGLRGTKESFKIRLNHQRNDKRKTLPLLSAQDVAILLKKEDLLQQRLYPLVLLVAMAIIAGGYHLYDKEKKFIESANVTTGKYVKGNGGYTKIIYRDESNRKLSYRDEFARFFPSSFSVNSGSKVRVYYLPESPSEVVVNRDIWQGLYYKMLMWIGLLVLIQSTISSIRRKSRMSRI
ncbi:MAG: hypothetical protein PHX61_10535 [Alphaproteobacteria bacterium]|nr:hypothetical protein [Alphaproteobacteria bacterium]